MKVYVVTEGSYSDYAIEKVFSNRQAAEEFKKWRRIQNDIEEWEVYDEPFDNQDGEKVMFIRIQGTVYPEAVVDLRYDIRPNIIHEGCITRGAGVYGLSDHKEAGFEIYIYHYIPADKWDEEKYKDKLTKALYDYAAMAKYMIAEGATMDMINLTLMNKENEDAESNV